VLLKNDIKLHMTLYKQAIKSKEPTIFYKDTLQYRTVSYL